MKNNKKTFRKAKKAVKKGYKKANKSIVKAIRETNGLTIINKQNKVMNFKRSNLMALTITNGAVSGTQSGINIIKFSDVPNYTEFTALFNKYRINWVKYSFRMVNTPDSTEEFPTLYTYKMNDPDDTAPLVTETSTEQQPYVKRMQFSETNRTFSTKIYPYWLSIIYSSTAVVGYTDNTAKKSAYIDTGYPNVSHYGLCYFIPSLAGSITTTWKIQVDLEYSLSFQDLC